MKLEIVATIPCIGCGITLLRRMDYVANEHRVRSTTADYAEILGWIIDPNYGPEKLFRCPDCTRKHQESKGANHERTDRH